ncbi:MAG TPA: glycosyltransferase family 2 protein [Vicinamibacterales bacterium]|nr:glycosyltransferase family 2 protein [Vicinamibacterales bacterium]
MTPAVAPLVRVVVLNFDGGPLTLACLDSLLATDYPADRLEIVLVDNGSLDDVVERVRREYPRVRVIEPFANLGFAGGCNLGIRAPGAFDYLALINNDATVSPGWLRPLVGVLEGAPDVAAASPKMLFADRYVAVELRVPGACTPSPFDARELGVRVSGVRVDGRRCDARVTFGEGFYAPEPPDPTRDEELARWTHARATMRIAVADAHPPRTLSIRVAAAAADQRVTGDGGAGAATAVVGTQPVWMDVPVGPPFDVINNAGSSLYPHAFGGDRGFLQRDRGQYDEPAETFGWCGGAVLLRREYLDTVGLFDESLFLYYEDFDLSWRGRLRGWRYRYEPASVVRHRHAATSGEWSPIFRFHTERNRVVVAVKNAPAGVAAWEVLAETKRLCAAIVHHVVAPLVRLRWPKRAEPSHRWRVWRSLVRLLPSALRHRWREPIVVSRVSILRWETRT